MRLWFYILNIFLHHSVLKLSSLSHNKSPQYNIISSTLSRFLFLSHSLYPFARPLALFTFAQQPPPKISKTFPRCCLWNFRKLSSATHASIVCINFTIAEMYVTAYRKAERRRLRDGKQKLCLKVWKILRQVKATIQNYSYLIAFFHSESFVFRRCFWVFVDVGAVVVVVLLIFRISCGCTYCTFYCTASTCL